MTNCDTISKEMLFVDALVPHLDFGSLIKMCLVNQEICTIVQKKYFRQWAEASLQWARRENNEPVEFGIDSFISIVTVRVTRWHLVGGTFGIPFGGNIVVTIRASVQSYHNETDHSLQKNTMMAEWSPLSDVFRHVGFLTVNMIFSLEQGKLHLSFPNSNVQTVSLKVIKKEVRYPHYEFEVQFGF